MRMRLVPVISGIEEILRRNEALVFAWQKLDVPVVFTEQYPKGGGHAVSRLPGLTIDFSSLRKKSNSMPPLSQNSWPCCQGSAGRMSS